MTPAENVMRHRPRRFATAKCSLSDRCDAGLSLCRRVEGNEWTALAHYPVPPRIGADLLLWLSKYVTPFEMVTLKHPTRASYCEIIRGRI